MNECRVCRYWRRQSAGTGSCLLLSSEPRFEVSRRAIAIADHQRDSASLLTRPDFGCADFAEKGLDETVAEG